MIKKKNISNLLILFFGAHLVLWTLAPTISNTNLPLDTIEHLAWGSNLDWGFNKHPPLVGVILELFYQIFGSQDWAYYFLSQIFIVLTFYIVYKFSEIFFENKVYALISILLLEGVYFYNFTTPEFNVNICQLPFWALTVLFCWRGFEQNQTLDWFLFGLFAALGVLSKYLFIYLLAAIGFFIIYMIFKKKLNQKCLIALAPFFLLMTPHLIWLTENDYVTLTYGLQRTGTGDQTLLDHIYNPFIFLIKQLGILIPFLFMLSFLVSKIKINFNLRDKRLIFLFFVSIVPIFLIFLTSIIMGVKIRTMWMTPFYLFIGLFFLYIFKKKLTLKKINTFFVSFLILFLISPTIYLYISFSQKDKRTDFPGKEIAELVERRWNRNFTNEIQNIIGDEWFAGNLSYHLKSRPKWFNDWPDKLENINLDGLIVTGNSKILKEVCPVNRGAIFGTIRKHGICMMGKR
tara:strand:+ start:767 stop:2146 length:1380 start_codon:yes stop_codon:yes gene_type:complete